MATEQQPPPPAGGLDRVEWTLFVFGVAAFAVLMLAFGEPLAGALYLPIVAVWLVGGLTFIWWFDRHLAGRAMGADQSKVRRIDARRRHR